MAAQSMCGYTRRIAVWIFGCGGFLCIRRTVCRNRFDSIVFVGPGCDDRDVPFIWRGRSVKFVWQWVTDELWDGVCGFSRRGGVAWSEDWIKIIMLWVDYFGIKMNEKV
jgi:hypothetical protein